MSCAAIACWNASVRFSAWDEEKEETLTATINSECDGLTVASRAWTRSDSVPLRFDDPPE